MNVVLFIALMVIGGWAFVGLIFWWSVRRGWVTVDYSPETRRRRQRDARALLGLFDKSRDRSTSAAEQAAKNALGHEAGE